MVQLFSIQKILKIFGSAPTDKVLELIHKAINYREKVKVYRIKFYEYKKLKSEKTYKDWWDVRDAIVIWFLVNADNRHVDLIYNK